MEVFPMATSRVFKAGNSQAVRIPHAMAFDASVQEVDIERHGDALVIRPRLRITMASLIDMLEAAPTPATPRQRPEIDWPMRARTQPEIEEPLG
jgi:antitoxin VapB